MADEQHRAVGGQRAQVLEQRQLGMHIEVAGRLVEDEQARVAQQRACEAQALPLPGRQASAVVTDGPDLLPLVREEYGSSTPISAFRTAGQALGALREGQASLAVLPLPQEVEERPWWPMLFGADEARPSIAARLPFAMPGQPPAEALVVARVEQAETGEDRSFLALETTDAVSRSGLKDAFAKTDLPVTFAASWHDAGRQAWLHLVEIDGYVAPGDSRLARLASAVGAGAREVRQVGGYAVPVSPALMGAEQRG